MGSYGSDFITAAWVLNPPVSMASVWPSGADFDTSWLPTTPTPWVTLSTTTGWPRRSLSLAPSVRDTRSGLPPAAVGMMIRNGRDGQAGACASDAPDPASAAPPASTNLRVRVKPVLPTPGLPWDAAGLAVGRNSCATY